MAVWAFAIDATHSLACPQARDRLSDYLLTASLDENPLLNIFIFIFISFFHRAPRRFT
jgi:hypothetical protein